CPKIKEGGHDMPSGKYLGTSMFSKPRDRFASSTESYCRAKPFCIEEGSRFNAAKITTRPPAIINIYSRLRIFLFILLYLTQHSSLYLLSAPWLLNTGFPNEVHFPGVARFVGPCFSELHRGC